MAKQSNYHTKKIKTKTIKEILCLIESSLNNGAPVIIAYNNNYLDIDKNLIEKLSKYDSKTYAKKTNFFDCNHMAIIYGYEKKGDKVINLLLQDSYDSNGLMKINIKYITYFSTYFVFLGGF